MSKSFELLKNRLTQEAQSHGRIAALAREVGVSRVTVDRWIAGESVPSLDIVDRVAAALGLEPWELLKPADPPEAAPLKTPAQVFAAIAALGDARLQAIARMDEADWAAVDFVLANAAEKLSPAQANDTQDKPARGKHRA